MSGAVSIGVAAVAIGGAIATEGATFAVIAAVGATVGAIGAVTHVKELQYAGAAIGVVGAVGGLASAAGAFGTGGVFGSGGSVFGGAGDAAGAAGSVASEGNISGFAAGGGPAGPSGGSLASTGIDAEISQWSGLGAQATDAGRWDTIGQIAGAADPNTASGLTAAWDNPASASGPATPATQSPSAGDVRSAWDPSGGEETGLGPSGQPDTAATEFNAAPKAPQAPGVGQVTGAPTNGTPAPLGSQPTPLEKLMGDPAAGTSVGSNSAWTKILDFAKNNDKLLSGVIQAGSSFLSGATNPLTPAQISAMNAQAKANQAAANKYQAETAILQQQGANMNAPMPIASRITGTPVGMMNRGVTGVPA